MNRQVFDTNKENYKEHFNRLLETLLTYNADQENDFFNDIHIYQEGSLLKLEWVEVPYSKDWGGSFKYVDEDEEIMKQVNFPDGHYEYVFPDEAEEVLEDWHKEHPEWQKTSYGTWTNVEENIISQIDLYLKDSINAATCDIITKENGLEKIKDDRRLHRSNFIVCNKKTFSILQSILKDILTNTELNNNYFETDSIYKFATLSFQLNKQQFDENAPVETYEDTIPVYICEDIRDDVFALCINTDYVWPYKIV